MLDLYDELTKVVAALDAADIEYALCGGIAMAVWGVARSTVDIDLLVEESSVEPIFEAVAPLGYLHRALPMKFSEGAIAIRRVSKIDPDGGDVLMLDLLLVTPPVEDVWRGRVQVEWEQGVMSVVSREGLIKLKSFRSSGRDLDDISTLRGES